MTDAMVPLRGLLEKCPDADLLREMIGFAAQRLMELEIGGRTGAGFGGKSPNRLAPRNGYRERDWETPLARSNCASRSCARAAPFPASWRCAAWRRRRPPP